MDGERQLMVIADDYGMGPETSRGILELAVAGPVTGTVLLVNALYVEEAVAAWKKAGPPADLGWHPNLTLDRPLTGPQRVPSLVGQDGCFWPLGAFLRRALTGRIRAEEVERELTAQLARFVQLVGYPPALVNSHQHCALFPPVGGVLRKIVSQVVPRPMVRRVQEPWWLLGAIPGGRLKRLVLNFLGRGEARRQRKLGLPGADWLAGLTEPKCLTNPHFFSRWLAQIPGQHVELMCHPGHHDVTLIGRDCHADDEYLQRRIYEWHWLRQPAFLTAVRQAGFTLCTPSAWLAQSQLRAA